MVSAPHSIVNVHEQSIAEDYNICYSHALLAFAQSFLPIDIMYILHEKTMWSDL